MPFSLRPYRRFAVQCSVTYSAGPFQDQGTVWNLSCTGWRLSGDLPMRPGENLSLTVTLPNEQWIEIPEAVVRWSRGQEFGIETVETPKHTQARLIHYVRRLVKDSVEVLHE
jgi:PilZ domain